MAKKPAPPPTLSPSSSSSSSSEEEDSSSYDEQTNDTKPDPQKTLTKKQESESESEGSSDEEEVDEDEDQSQRPVNSTPSKLEFESDSEPEKIVTPSKPIPEKSNGKSPFTRLWSVDDEIAILEAMVDYQSKNSPIKLIAAGVKGFHESVRKSLSIDVSAAKLAAKMRWLWKKYTDANKKGDKVKFAKPHDKTIYELSKKVWGKEEEEKEEKEDDGFKVETLNGNSSGVTVNKGKSLKREFPFIRDALGGNRLALEMLKKVDVEKAVILEKKFKKLKFAEINLIRKAYKVVCEEAEKLVN